MQNQEYKAILHFLSNGRLPTNFSSTKSNFIKKANKFTVKNGKLYKGDLAVVKFSEQKKIFDSTPALRNPSENLLKVLGSLRNLTYS